MELNRKGAACILNAEKCNHVSNELVNVAAKYLLLKTIHCREAVVRGGRGPDCLFGYELFTEINAVEHE